MRQATHGTTPWILRDNRQQAGLIFILNPDNRNQSAPPNFLRCTLFLVDGRHCQSYRSLESRQDFSIPEARLISTVRQPRKMMRNNQQTSSRAGFTIFDLLVFIAAAVPASFISRYFGEKRPGLIFAVFYVPLGFFLWALVFVWVPRGIHRIRHGKDSRSDKTG